MKIPKLIPSPKKIMTRGLYEILSDGGTQKKTKKRNYGKRTKDLKFGGR